MEFTLSIPRGVTGAAEVIVHIARRAKAVTFFGWVAAGPGDAEVLLHE